MTHRHLAHAVLLGYFGCVCCCSVTKLCPTLCSRMDCHTLGFPVIHYLPEFAPTHVHWVSNAIQSSHPLSLPSLLALNLSQHQGLFKWDGSLHQVAKVLELQLQHQSFRWIFRVDFQSISMVWSPSCLRESQEFFSSTAVQKHQFFGTHPSLWSTSYICTWLLEKP